MRKLYCYVTSYPTLCFGDSERMLRIFTKNDNFDDFISEIYCTDIINPATGEAFYIYNIIGAANYLAHNGWTIEQSAPFWLFSKETDDPRKEIDNIPVKKKKK